MVNICLLPQWELVKKNMVYHGNNDHILCFSYQLTLSMNYVFLLGLLDL